MMRNLVTRLKTLEQKNTKPCTAEQRQALYDILSYLDNLAERKACGDKLVQSEIEAVKHFLRQQ